MSWRRGDDMQCMHCLALTDGVSSFTGAHTPAAPSREENEQRIGCTHSSSQLTTRTFLVTFWLMELLVSVLTLRVRSAGTEKVGEPWTKNE